MEGAPEFIPGLPVEAPAASVMHGTTPGMGETAAGAEPVDGGAVAAETPGAAEGGKKAEASTTEDAAATTGKEGAEATVEEGGKAEKQSESAATAGAEEFPACSQKRMALLEIFLAAAAAV